jgi:hypothetical protein
MPSDAEALSAAAVENRLAHRNSDPASIGPGSTIFPDKGTESGTLGMIVSRGANLYLLTCSHALAGATAVYARIESKRVRIADEIRRIPLLPNSKIVADAAVARLLSGVEVTASFPALMGNVTATPMSPAIGMEVLHHGAASRQVRSARIAKWPLQVRIKMAGKLLHFANVAATDSAVFAARGDSGSIAVDRDTGNPVGIVFACNGTVLLAPLAEALRHFRMTPVPARFSGCAV